MPYARFGLAVAAYLAFRTWAVAVWPATLVLVAVGGYVAVRAVAEAK